MVTYADLQPSQAIRAQRLGISKLQQAPGQVCPQMIEVGVHGVGPPPEVQVVWEVKAILIHVIFCHLKEKKDAICVSQIQSGPTCQDMGQWMLEMQGCGKP